MECQMQSIECRIEKVKTEKFDTLHFTLNTKNSTFCILHSTLKK
ncbi:hypothetical protein FHS57_002342 [Runella defluvii]|uniref:Uncharacterized protein n=1 Tax=Runella defluvii TaxID=370973 RepID=A0A7W6EQE4_9BACT|nr:hypothetical protein [Runella defluvii]